MRDFVGNDRWPGRNSEPGDTAVSSRGPRYWRALLRALALLGVVGTTAVALAQLQSGSPWPKYRANTLNTGMGAASGAQSIERWVTTTNSSVASSPAVAKDGTVYVGSEDFSLYAMNGATGAVEWSFPTGSYVISSPAIGADGTVYVGSYDDKVYALNGTTGALEWSFTTGGVVDSSPTIGSDGTVYVGSNDDKLYALDGTNGAMEWSFLTGGAIQSSPAIGADGTIYVGSQDSNVYAVDPTTGTKMWSFVTGGGIGTSPAIGSDGTVYIGSVSTLYALDGTTGIQDWAFVAGSSIGSSPAVGANGDVYFGSYDENVYALDGVTGDQKWKFLTENIVQSAPSIGSDGTVYVGSDDFNVYALDGELGTEKWTFTTENAVDSSPAIGSDGTLYVGGHDRRVYAIGTPYKLSNFYANPTSVIGGHSFNGVVQITGAAGPVGYVVSLASDTAGVTVPATVTIAAGSTGKSFLIQTALASSATTATLTASFNSSSKQIQVTVEPYSLSDFYVNPTSVLGNHRSNGVVQLAGDAGASGNIVSLQSNNACATVPASVTVPSGTTGASFQIETSDVGSEQTVTLSATFNSLTLQATLVVNPYVLSSFYVSPTTVVGSNRSTGVVQISGPAATGGDVVALFSGNGCASVPTNVTIAAGGTGASFQVETSVVASQHAVTLTATLGSVSLHATLTVNPYGLSHFYV